MKGRVAKSHGNKRVCGYDQNQDLRRTGDMVIEEASPRGVVGYGVLMSINPRQQEVFEDVEANNEVDDEDDGDDERAERRQIRDSSRGTWLT